MADLHKLIAVISPDLYCDAEVRKEVKEIVKKSGYQAALGKAKPLKTEEVIILDDAKYKPLLAPGLRYPIEKHRIVSDSMTESLEPLYFWVIDFMYRLFRKVDKINDNFVAAPGSGYFSELGQKATAMQEKAMSMFGTVNTVLKSILNIVYDLKEFRTRLETYNDFHSTDKAKRDSAYYSLKQVWMDNVDIKRGNTSLKGLVAQFDYVTIIDAFMIAETAEMVDKIDLNDRVKRIVQQRVEEFNRWVKESEIELRKRYEIERQYLKSQYNNIQLYARWIAPYLKAANKLEQNAKANEGLVSTFNTVLLELTLIGQSEYDPEDDVRIGNLPKSFKHPGVRKYYSILVVDFTFRGLPQRVGQGYSYGGKTTIDFTSYSLNQEELDTLKKEADTSNFGDVLGLIEGATSESLAQIKDDVEMFIGDKKDKKVEPREEDSNPFSTLFSGFGSFFKTEKKKDEEKDLSRGIGPDDEWEKVIRSQAILEAVDKNRTIQDVYKRAHSMFSYP